MVAGTKNSSHRGINGKRKTFSDSVNVGNGAISLATTAAEVEMTNDDQKIAQGTIHILRQHSFELCLTRKHICSAERQQNGPFSRPTDPPNLFADVIYGWSLSTQ